MTGRRPAASRLNRALVVALLALALSGAALLRPAPTTAAPNPGVLPPDGPHHGKTYAEWSAAWWQWLAAQDADEEIFCGPSGSGPVWFLNGGPVGTPATIPCAIPAGTPLFTPILTAECSTAEGNGTTEAELRACAVGLTDQITVAEASIDGAPVQDTRQFRVQSPLFTLTLPEGNLLGLPPGTTPSVSDGYWLFLAPLAPGRHSVRVRGVVTEPDGTVALEALATFELTVGAAAPATTPSPSPAPSASPSARPSAAPSAPPAANPGVAPTASRPTGRTYGEWAAAWWQWFGRIPADRHPLNDDSGADCSVGQTGAIWFLGGTAGGPPVTRRCAVPAGTALFAPLIAYECSTAEGNGATEAELRACANAGIDAVSDVRASLDGREVRDVRQYRAQSPPFTFTLVEGNLFGLPAGPTPAVADGYWLFLEPLPPGQHTLTLRGVIATPGGEPFESEVTYLLTVAAPAPPPAGGGGNLPGLPNTGAGGGTWPDTGGVPSLPVVALVLGLAALARRAGSRERS